MNNSGAKSYGSLLLRRAENLAIENSCDLAYLSTFAFQAPAFYEKRGYVRVGVVDGYPGGAQQIFMRKELAPSRA